jgi:hypothetical protein
MQVYQLQNIVFLHTEDFHIFLDLPVYDPVAIPLAALPKSIAII